MKNRQKVSIEEAKGENGEYTFLDRNIKIDGTDKVTVSIDGKDMFFTKVDDASSLESIRKWSLQHAQEVILVKEYPKSSITFNNSTRHWEVEYEK